MCKNCNEHKDCNKLAHCIEVINPISCDKGCETTSTTDCIFHNINNDDQSAKLPNIGIPLGTTLKYILKAIDRKLGEAINTNFKLFNMHGLNTNIEITNIQEFVEAITAALKTNGDFTTLLSDELEALGEVVSALTETVELNNNPNLSNSALNINTTDTVSIVLGKLITYLNDLPEPIAPKNFENSDTITFSSNTTTVTADLKLSAQSGNRGIILEDGFYVTDPSISYILESIRTNPELKVLFTNLINGSFPPFSYDIMSTTNQAITYINRYNTEVTVTAQANKLLVLNDVKKIITNPVTGLTITFKGI